MPIKKTPKYYNIKISKNNLFCLWAAVILREPEPLTRLIKKILKPTVLSIERKSIK